MVRPYKVLLLACAANCTTGTLLALWKGEGEGNGAIEAIPENRARKLERTPKYAEYGKRNTKENNKEHK